MFENRILKDFRKRRGVLFALVCIPLYLVLIPLCFIFEEITIGFLILIFISCICFIYFWLNIFFQFKYNKVIKSMSDNEKMKLEQSYLKNKWIFKNITFLDEHILSISEFGQLSLIKYSDITMFGEGISGRRLPTNIAIYTKYKKSQVTYLKGNEKISELKIYIKKYVPHAKII